MIAIPDKLPQSAAVRTHLRHVIEKHQPDGILFPMAAARAAALLDDSPFRPIRRKPVGGKKKRR